MFLTWLAIFLLFTRVTTEPPRVLSCCIFLFCNHLIFSLKSSISCSVARLSRVYSSMCERRVVRLFFNPESSIIRRCRPDHDINKLWVILPARAFVSIILQTKFSRNFGATSCYVRQRQLQPKSEKFKNKHTHTPFNKQWTLTFQHQLMFEIVISFC